MAVLASLIVLLQIGGVFSGSVLEIDFPSVIIDANGDGNVTFKSGEHGDVHLLPGKGGTVLYNGYDLLDFVKIMRGLPPVWGSPAASGFEGKYTGGDNVNITLNAKDPENNDLEYSVVAGDLPPGIVLDRHAGVIRGIAPDENALYVVTVRASDKQHKHADIVLRFETRDTDRCLRFSPCKNGGSCVDKKGYYECHCSGNFGGRDCEKFCNETSFGVDAALKLIPDAQMSAYKSKNSLNFSLASNGRYHGTGWCGTDKSSWLQVDLGESKYVHMVLMEGIATNQYTGVFSLQYSINGTEPSFTDYLDPVSGNPHNMTMVGHGVNKFNLPSTLVARYVRFKPVSYGINFTPCMKVDIFGCDFYY